MPDTKCAGVIVFDKDKTIIVTNHQNRCSFPKGRKEHKESDIETALRELKEETGITGDHIKLTDIVLHESGNDKNNPVTYFVAHLIKDIKHFSFDEKELKHVKWVTVDEACQLKNLKDKRKEILLEAVKKLKKN